MADDKKRAIKISLSPLYKKRLIQGVLFYLFIVFILGIGIFSQADLTVERWEQATPTSTAMISRDRLGIHSQLDFNDNGGGVTGNDLTAPAVGSRGSVALVVTGLGLSHSATTFAIEKLPKDIALAFSPYAKDIKSYLNTARRAQHETLILMPMESTKYPLNDSGPKTLLVNARDEDNNRNFFSTLALANSSIGVMNFMGSKFLTDEGKMKSIFKTLRAKNMLFLENTEGRKNSLSHESAMMAGATYLSSDILLDSPPTPENILTQLKNLEREAAVKGQAIGVIHAWPSSLDTLKNWVASLDSRGIRLVPLTAMTKTSEDTSTTKTAPKTDQEK